MTTEKNEDRIRRNGADIREDRVMQDRAISEDRVMTDEERLQLFRMQHFQHVLPDLPQIKGYHVCWLSTTNQSDTIASRMRLGYEPVRREDVPGWNFDQASLKTGEYAGFIGINEMVAFKVKDNLYQMYMKHAHHDEPNRQSEKLVQDVKSIQEQAKDGKSYVEQFDGQDSIEKELRAKQPAFE